MRVYGLQPGCERYAAGDVAAAAAVAAASKGLEEDVDAAGVAAAAAAIVALGGHYGPEKNIYPPPLPACTLPKSCAPPRFTSSDPPPTFFVSK